MSSSSDDEDILNLPNFCTGSDVEKEFNNISCKKSLSTNYCDFRAQPQDTSNNKFQFRSRSFEENKRVGFPLTNSSETVTVFLSSAAFQSLFMLKVFESLRNMICLVQENTNINAACIYWSREISKPLTEAPFVHVCSAEDFLMQHCTTETSLLEFAQTLKSTSHGGRTELILFGYQDLKQKSGSICNSKMTASHLERIKEFSLLLYVKEYIHCLWMDSAEQVATYIVYMTKAIDNLLKRGPRERTMLSEFGNHRKFARASKESHTARDSFKDIYSLILERSLGRRSKAVDTIITVYPTLYHLRQAVSKNTEQEFIREFKNKLTSANASVPAISTQILLQIHRCFCALG